MIPLSDPDLRRRSNPFVNHTLVIINVAVFIYQLTLGEVGTFVFQFRFGVLPAVLAGNSPPLGIEFIRGIGEVDLTSPIPPWATTFSSMFMHGGFVHIAGNMLFLWVFGDNIEDRFGHTKYLLFYLVAGVIAVVAQVAVIPNEVIPVVGASGAIAGVLGAYLVLFPLSRVNTLIILGFIFVIRIYAFFLIGFWALLQAFSGFGSVGADTTAGDNVAYFAHLGGFVLGVAIALLYRVIAGYWGLGNLPRRPYRAPLYPPDDDLRWRP